MPTILNHGSRASECCSPPGPIGTYRTGANGDASITRNTQRTSGVAGFPETGLPAIDSETSLTNR